MKSTTRVQLSLLMFLEFFIWGSWYVTMGTYLDKVLHATGIQVGAAYSAMAIATIISPFFVGMIADRYFPAQRVLGILHLAGATLLYYLTTITSPDSFYWVLLLYSLCYAPTLALANSVAFRQMKDTSKEFASIRVLGTIGWIVVGLTINAIQNYPLKQSTSSGFLSGLLNFFWNVGVDILNRIASFFIYIFSIVPGNFANTNLSFTFLIASIFSALLGIIAFTLPSTPAKAKGTKATFAQILGADSFVLFKDRSFVIFFIASVLICIPLSFYYSFTNLYLTDAGMKNVTSNMTFGQFSEAFFILLIPFFFRRLGVKWMIVLGMIAWTLRFLCFGYGNADNLLWLLFAGIILHGVCFDFFFVTGQIYTDSKAGLQIQSQAQGMITMATYGIGMWIGTLLSGYVKDYFTNNNVVDWKSTWMVPAGIAFFVLILFVLFFKDNQRTAARAEAVEMV